MMETRFVPNKFWSKVVFTTIYLLNRSPTITTKQKTPKEAWSERKPKVDHLKVFGFIACAYIPNDERTKLDRP
jgi:hypothetical protein